MNLKEKSRVLGLGNYGGKQAKEFITSYGYKGDAVNGSEQDLKALGDIPKYQLKGFDGFGGNREKAMECLEQNPDFLEFVATQAKMENLKRLYVQLLRCHLLMNQLKSIPMRMTL